MSIRAADAGFLLQAMSRGGALELAPDQERTLAWMREAGLVRAAADPANERERLAQLRAELEQIGIQRRLPGATAASLEGRERQARAESLEISDRLAEIEGACEVTSISGGGPYRGAAGASRSRWLVTQKGRALLSDLAPRMVRIGHSSIEQFGQDMHALRVALAWRVDRAAQIRAAIQAIEGEAIGASLRSVSIGLSAVRAEPKEIASAFSRAWRALRPALSESRFATGQDATTAEALCLQASDLAAVERGPAVREVVALRHQILAAYAQGHTEDALDAAVLLHGAPVEQQTARIEVAGELAREVAAKGYSIPISLALLATAGDATLPPYLEPSLRGAGGALERELPTPAERLTVAVLLTFARGDLVGQLERWRLLREYLARFSPEGMGVAAALLSWLALEPSETLDDLRLAASEIQKQRLADGGAETMSLAIKLLVSVAMLASGSEGDHEEKLALAPRVVPRAPQLGVHGAMTAMPLVSTALTAFHRPVLEAAIEYERAYQSTHSSYVFGGGGWG